MHRIILCNESLIPPSSRCLPSPVQSVTIHSRQTLDVRAARDPITEYLDSEVKNSHFGYTGRLTLHFPKLSADGTRVSRSSNQSG